MCLQTLDHPDTHETVCWDTPPQLSGAMDSMFGRDPASTVPEHPLPAAPRIVRHLHGTSEHGAFSVAAFASYVSNRLFTQQGYSVFWKEHAPTFRLARFVLQCGLVAGVAAACSDASTDIDAAVRAVLQVCYSDVPLFIRSTAPCRLPLGV